MRKYLNHSTVKTLKHILWAFLATAVWAGCSDDPTYTKGAEENPDNYGVYFPQQDSPVDSCLKRLAWKTGKESGEAIRLNFREA